jgi:hypothetical protein
VKTPRRPSSQVTSTPCLVQACAIAGPAAPAVAAATQIAKTIVRVMIMPPSAN